MSTTTSTTRSTTARTGRSSSAVRRGARRGALGAGLAVTAVLAGAAAPAQAADTLVTFVVTEVPGQLSISAPPSATLGSAQDGELLSGALGDVTVDDQRGDLVGGWSSDVWASKAVSAEGNQIPASAFTYTTGPATTSPLGLTVDTSTASAVLGGALPVPAASTVTVGKSRATWSPVLYVNVPAGTPAGTYSFTLTHSVS